MATATEAQGSVNLPLQDRVAIVTGASRGIGRAIAFHLASLGARVVVNYTRNAAQADLAVAEINNSYASSAAANTAPRAVAVCADVSDLFQVKALFDTAENFFKAQPHVIVNSAGTTDSTYSAIANTAVEDFDRIFSVNARGAFLCCKEAANRLKRGGGGRIIMITSSIVGGPLPRHGAYAGSKAAVETMVKILAKELKGTRITANCVSPGPVETELFFSGKTEEQVKKAMDACPHGRLGKTEDVAPVVGFLATDGSEWVNGQVIRVNGGYV